jgi:hypothetical protein
VILEGIGTDGVTGPKSVPFFKSGYGKADLSGWGVNRSARARTFYETIMFDLLRPPSANFKNSCGFSKASGEKGLRMI